MTEPEFLPALNERLVRHVIAQRQRLGFIYPPDAVERATASLEGAANRSEIIGRLECVLLYMEAAPPPRFFRPDLAPWRMAA